MWRDRAVSGAMLSREGVLSEMNIIMFLLARLKEPSTYAGLGALLAAAGYHIPDATLNAAISVVVAVAGLAAIVIPEFAGKPKEQLK